MIDLDFGLVGLAIQLVLSRELETDFIGIPGGPLPLPILVNDLAIVTIDIGFPGEDVEDDTAGGVIA